MGAPASAVGCSGPVDIVPHGAANANALGYKLLETRDKHEIKPESVSGFRSNKSPK